MKRKTGSKARGMTATFPRMRSDLGTFGNQHPRHIAKDAPVIDIGAMVAASMLAFIGRRKPR